MKTTFVFIIFLLSTADSFAQWVVGDQKSMIDTLDSANWNPVVNYGGNELYCGLPADDETYTYIYHKFYSPDLVYFNQINLKDSSFVRGYYRLINDTYNDKVVLCWIPDMLWEFFDKDKILHKEEFYSLGELIKPQSFKLIYKD